MKHKSTKKYRNLYKKLFGSGLQEDEAIKLLGLKSDYTEEELKKKHRELAMKYHPDMPTGDQAKFIEIQTAYELLLDDIKKRIRLPEPKKEDPIVKYFGELKRDKDKPIGEEKVKQEYDQLRNKYKGISNELKELEAKEKMRPLTKYEDKLKPELIKIMLASKERDEKANIRGKTRDSENTEYQNKLLEHYDRILTEEYMFNQPPSAFTGHGLKRKKGGCCEGGEVKKKSCANPWMAFLSAFREDHKGEYSVTEMTQRASIAYKKIYKKE